MSRDESPSEEAPTLAGMKGDLAALGASVAPSAQLKVYDSPSPGLVDVVILQRVDSGPAQHCVHGYTGCITCGAYCYLGHETAVALTSEADLYPLCMTCAAANEQLRERSGPSKQLDDGPHD